MRYALRRGGFFLLTLWAAITLNFLLPRLMPGNPGQVLLAKSHGRLSKQGISQMEAAFGVHTGQSLPAQYVEYLKNTVTLHLGTSISYFPNSVWHEIKTAMPWTVGLVGLTTVLAFLAGTLLGMVSAWRRGGVVDNVLPTVFVVGTAFPYFWIAMLLILVFADTLNWFPTAFGYDNTLTIGFNPQFISSVIHYGILPAVTLMIASVGMWVLTMRNTMITVLAEDYVRMARAKGLSNTRVMWSYAARNAMLPNLTGFAMSFGFVVSGAILIEYVFNYPGLGFMLLQAVNNEDYPLMQGLFLLISVCVLVAILVADGLTAILDPRTREKG